jgi:8-oxo-dGTP pyrophosphatase MutT (NUDIX family)
MSISYVMSVITDPSHEEYVMISKNRPEFLKGKTTFVGGKVEKGETIVAAMIREASEECNLDIEPQLFGYIFGEDYTVFVFKAVVDNIYEAVTMEDEKITVYSKEEIVMAPDHALADNVKSIIHFANGNQKTFEIYQ